MAYKILNKNGDWLVQVQRDGIRKSKRGQGGEPAAKRAEILLIAEIDSELRLRDAAALLGVPTPGTAAAAPVPSLREYFESRWVEHSKVVQNESTRRISRSPWNYVLWYLGDKNLVELLSPSVINGFIEAMKTNGGRSFAVRANGAPRRKKHWELTNATINQSLKNLRALLYLAHSEGVVPAPPRIDLLPTDDSTPVIPPTEEQFQHLLRFCRDFRAIAPYMPEVAEFTAETGLRRGEVFHLTWASVDLARSAIRIEMHSRGRVVNGRAWRPKHNKWREVPLSTRAKAILVQLRKEVPSGGDDLVFPNQGGAPYDRMDHAPTASGKGWFFEVVETAGLKGKVTFHGLRHLFAVRLLTRGVPITVVSELLGHSDINLTVKRYGRFSSDAKVKWDAVKVLDAESDAPPPLVALRGGRDISK